MTKKVLYVGLNPPSVIVDQVEHCPLIHIVPRSIDNLLIQNSFQDIEEYTHVVFTSKNGVRIFFKYLDQLNIKIGHQHFIAIGKATAQAIEQCGQTVLLTSNDEHAEGLIAAIDKLSFANSYFFWPHSAGSRQVIPNYFKLRNIRFRECVFYETQSFIPSSLPDLKKFQEIVFTSPSTVDAFIEAFGEIPWGKKITPIGPVTEAHLKKIKGALPK
jgi:uroporphyrinogen-III synthase